MNIKHVDKTIKSCLVATFTGKIAVRVVNGEIVACDVGAVGTGMPHVGHAELMKRCIPPSGPSWREYMTDDERQELERAEADLADAKALVEERDKAWAEAERAYDAAERRAYASADRAQLDSGPDAAGQDRLSSLRSAVERAQAAWQEARDLEGEARVAQTTLQARIYNRCHRRMTADQEPETAAPAAAKKSLRERMSAIRRNR